VIRIRECRHYKESHKITTMFTIWSGVTFKNRRKRLVQIVNRVSSSSLTYPTLIVELKKERPKLNALTGAKINNFTCKVSQILMIPTETQKRPSIM